MSGLNAGQLLNAWETGLRQTPVERAITLLGAAAPERSWDEWAWLPVGTRDLRLIELRESLFGTQIAATASCPQCSERLDISFSTSDVKVGAPAQVEIFEIVEQGYRLRYRLPVSHDLMAVAAARGDAHTLFARCVESAHDSSGAVRPVDSLPLEVIAGITDAMAKADPQADIETAIDCTSCGHAWMLPFDIVTYLWSDIEEWCQKMLRDVAILARHFGWSEHEVLELSPWRRRLYIEMCGE